MAISLACMYPCGAGASKKLIEYGWDVPDTAYVREHVAEMEKVPFDGVVIRVDARKGSKWEGTFGWNAFTARRFEAADWTHVVDDLKATSFKRFTDNFLQLTVYPGDVDWFAPEWATIAHNVGLLARLAKQGGCKGIMFDPEAYGKQIWHYKGLPEEWRKNHTFAEYQAKVKERGREFMRAINAEYPDITILALYGPYCPLWMAAGAAPEDQLYGLFRDFYDGVLEVAAPGTVIVDGFESSYGYREKKKFVKGKDVILNQAKKLYSDAKKYEEHVRAGFGIWADYGTSDKNPWNKTDFSKNYFTPDGLRESLANALEVSDGYVWVYSERLRWWNPSEAPDAYVKALALCKDGPGPGQPNPPPR